ncbi:hypothetical protein N7462_007651 [Penicillium macrosclerotiorum]|uniref:uncharacterized protein n=1 Tax=Penicillium macrosclerotiorum TaxID=303699 RepID=UPI0025472046|nr:uncharacterized protein N7462_007651 [Penicillium macrosclerotiorum]KAJ5679407.1 hypothetical protein N7462_007651 [Penicillium macrosclerotiorum]
MQRRCDRLFRGDSTPHSLNATIRSDRIEWRLKQLARTVGRSAVSLVTPQARSDCEKGSVGLPKVDPRPAAVAGGDDAMPGNLVRTSEGKVKQRANGGSVRLSRIVE